MTSSATLSPSFSQHLGPWRVCRLAHPRRGKLRLVPFLASRLLTDHCRSLSTKTVPSDLPGLWSTNKYLLENYTAVLFSIKEQKIECWEPTCDMRGPRFSLLRPLALLPCLESSNIGSRTSSAGCLCLGSVLQIPHVVKTE